MSQSENQDPSPARLFERFFGPSIFHPWTPVLLERAGPRPGERVLDLACATGIVARHAARELAGGGEVVGLDVDPEMLAVARERASSEGLEIEWRQGDAHDLDFGDDTFDVVTCQQGVQFFDEPSAALAEVRRVLADGGRLALNVWKPLEHHPVYQAVLEAEAQHLGAELADVARPFTFGGRERLRSLLDGAGFGEVDISERTMEAEFSEPETFVTLTVMAGAAVVPELALDDEGEREALIEAVRDASAEVLARHRERGRLSFPMPNQIAVARA